MTGEDIQPKPESTPGKIMEMHGESNQKQDMRSLVRLRLLSYRGTGMPQNIVEYHRGQVLKKSFQNRIYL